MNSGSEPAYRLFPVATEAVSCYTVVTSVVTERESAMEFVNTRTAKAKLSHYLNNLESTGPVIITSNGVPKGILTVFSEDDIDDFVIRHSEKIHKMVMEGLEDTKQGKTYTVDEAFAKVDKMEKEIDED